MPDQKPFSTVASELLESVEDALPTLRAISERDAALPRAPWQVVAQAGDRSPD